MEDAIKQSLSQFSQQQIQPHKLYSTRYNKSNSFTQLSDWNNRHKFLNESFVLPRIMEEPEVQRVRRVAESQSSDYVATIRRKHQIPTNLIPINIKFSVPDCLRGFQESFYDHYLKQKKQRKGVRIKLIENNSVQQQIKNRSLQKNVNKMKSQYEQARASIINRVMNRKTRLKRQHFLQEYLTTNTMQPKIQEKQRSTLLSVQKSKEKDNERQRQRQRQRQRSRQRQRDNERQREKNKNKQKHKQQV